MAPSRTLKKEKRKEKKREITLKETIARGGARRLHEPVAVPHPVQPQLIRDFGRAHGYDEEFQGSCSEPS